MSSFCLKMKMKLTVPTLCLIVLASGKPECSETVWLKESYLTIIIIIIMILLYADDLLFCVCSIQLYLTTCLS